MGCVSDELPNARVVPGDEPDNHAPPASSWLPERLAGAHVGTLRRTFFERPGQLYCTPEALIVYLDRFRGQEALIPLIDNVNAQGCRLPWLENRRLVISLTPGSQHGGP